MDLSGMGWAFMIVKPYSGVKQYTGSVVQHFWRANGTYQGGLEDSVGGAHFIPSGANVMADNGNYVGIHENGPMPVTISGPMTGPGTDALLIFSVFSVSGAGGYIFVGDGASDVSRWEVNRGIVSDTHVAGISDGAQTRAVAHSDFVAANSTLLGIGCMIQAGVSVDIFSIGADGVKSANLFNAAALGSDEDPFTNMTSIGPFNTDNVELGGNAINGIDKFYGCIHCHFSSVPTDYSAACSWMYSEWLKSNKYVYPGWL